MTYTSTVTRSRAALALPLAYTPTPKAYQMITCARLDLAGIVSGDLVHVSAHGQASTRSGITRAMHCRYVKATKTGSNLPNEGLMLAKPMGTNVTDAIHHSLLSASGSFVADAVWSGSIQLLLVMYAANLTSDPTDPRSLSVDYVELRADVSRGA